MSLHASVRDLSRAISGLPGAGFRATKDVTILHSFEVYRVSIQSGMTSTPASGFPFDQS